MDSLVPLSQFLLPCDTPTPRSGFSFSSHLEVPQCFHCPFGPGKGPGPEQRWRTRLIQTEVPQGQRDADPEGQLDPDQHAGLEGVAVVPDVELRDDTAQVLLELEPELKHMSVHLV